MCSFFQRGNPSACLVTLPTIGDCTEACAPFPHPFRGTAGKGRGRAPRSRPQTSNLDLRSISCLRPNTVAIFHLNRKKTSHKPDTKCALSAPWKFFCALEYLLHVPQNLRECLKIALSYNTRGSRLISIPLTSTPPLTSIHPLVTIPTAKPQSRNPQGHPESQINLRHYCSSFKPGRISPSVAQ